MNVYLYAVLMAASPIAGYWLYLLGPKLDAWLAKKHLRSLAINAMKNSAQNESTGLLRPNRIDGKIPS